MVAQAVGGGLRSDGLDLGERPSAPSVCHTPMLNRVSHMSLEPQGTGLGPGGQNKYQGLMDEALGELSQEVVSVVMSLGANNS